MNKEETLQFEQELRMDEDEERNQEHMGCKFDDWYSDNEYRLKDEYLVEKNHTIERDSLTEENYIEFMAFAKEEYAREV